MGDPESGPQPSGLLPDKAAAYAESFAKSRSIDSARWTKAEQCTTELIKRIRGTESSEVRRKEVADFVADLIRKCFDCQVYTFGSVPLKTYLPDGDIDLTIMSRDPRLKETWANSVRSTLERAERSQDSKFRVKEVQYINAEVKLIKCHVGNIVVDISFNQLGGLCTLCFLEEVDQVIGKNHFFKRSIILIKAWCYYESTILGAHHGLISTYALETLVLYIFHVFHPSLQGPFEVLLRFLEFFGKFDWQKYAISVWGPVPLLSLPDMIAEPPRKDGGELLLTKAFLDACLNEYAIFVSGPDSQGRAFTAKHLNVVDPLRSGNNLGRSVNQTNFLRIAKVLGHSADRLLKILLDPNKDVEECFRDKETGFFKRTNDRLHGFEEQRPDVADGIIESGGRSGNEKVDSGRSSRSETYFVDHSSVRNPVGQNFELDFMDQGRGSQTQLSGTKVTSMLPLVPNSEHDAALSEGASYDSMLAARVPSCRVTISAASIHEPVRSSGKGVVLNSEAEKPLGSNAKPIVNSSGGNLEVISDVSRLTNGRECGSHSTQRSDQKDLESVMGDQTLQVPVCRSNSTQTDLEFNGDFIGNSDRHAALLVPGISNVPTELIHAGNVSIRNGGLGHDLPKEGFHRGGWVGEQTPYVDPNGILDGQGYVQHREQDTVNRGSIPLPITSPVQLPLTLSHSGQSTMQLAKPLVSMSTNKGLASVSLTATPPLGMPSLHSSLIGESPLGHSPRTGLFYATQRGPPPPPGYFQGPPLAQQLPPIGEISNGGGSRLLPTYPGPQEYSYLQPVSTISATVSPPSHPYNSESSFVLSSPPPIATSGPFHIPNLSQVPRTQVSQIASSKPRIAYPGSVVNLESLGPNSRCANDLPEDAQSDETSKQLQEDREVGSWTASKTKFSSQAGSDSGGKGKKSSKANKDKKAINKNKSTSSEDDLDLGVSEDGMQSSAIEGSILLPIQEVADENLQMVPGYSQLVAASGSAVVPAVYPHMVSSLPPPGSGMMISESSLYSPSLAPTPRVTQTSNQSTPMSVGIPNQLSNSARPAAPELGNGSSSISTVQRQRHMDRTPPAPPNVYFPAGNHYQYLSMYSAYPIYMLPQSPDPHSYIQFDYGGLPYIRSFDNYHDLTAVQSDEFRTRGTQQGRLGVGERLRAAGVATSAISKLESTSTDRASDTVNSTSSSSDLLSSDFSDHLNNLQYALWCQNMRGQMPLQAQPPYLFPLSKNISDYRPWEGPGRPSHPTVSMLPTVMGHGHGLVQGHQPLNASSARMAGNFGRGFAVGPASYGAEEPAKSYGGTGTYLPNPPPPYIRQRPSSGNGRNQIGAYNHERGERADRDVTQVHGARFRGNGRGQNKHEPRSHQGTHLGVDRNYVDAKSGERGRDRDFHRQHENSRKNQTPSSTGPSCSSSNPSGASPISVLPSASIGIPPEIYPVPIMTGTPTSGTVEISPVVYPPEKRADLVEEPFEFGSLGPLQVGTSQGGIQDSGPVSMRTQEQVNAHSTSGLAGLSLASSDRRSQGSSSPKHRVMQRAYQLKEEDFPPLPFFVGSIQADRQV